MKKITPQPGQLLFLELLEPVSYLFVINKVFDLSCKDNQFSIISYDDYDAGLEVYANYKSRSLFI